METPITPPKTSVRFTKAQIKAITNESIAKGIHGIYTQNLENIETGTTENMSIHSYWGLLNAVKTSLRIMKIDTEYIDELINEVQEKRKILKPEIFKNSEEKSTEEKRRRVTKMIQKLKDLKDLLIAILSFPILALAIYQMKKQENREWRKK